MHGACPVLQGTKWSMTKVPAPACVLACLPQLACLRACPSLHACVSPRLCHTALSPSPALLLHRGAVEAIGFRWQERSRCYMRTSAQCSSGRKQMIQAHASASHRPHTCLAPASHLPLHLPLRAQWIHLAHYRQDDKYDTEADEAAAKLAEHKQGNAASEL